MASVYTQKLLHKDAFTHRDAFPHSKHLHTKSFTHSKLSHTASFYTQQAFTHSKRLHTGHLHTVLLHMATVYTHRNFYTETLLQTEKLLHTASFYTQDLLHTASVLSQQELQLQDRSSTPKQQNHDFEALSKRNFKREITSEKIAKICWQITIAAWMLPLQYDLRSSAAKDNSIMHAAAARSNLDAAITLRSAETDLQNIIELRVTASEIAASKPDLDAKATKRRFWSTF